MKLNPKQMQLKQDLANSLLSKALELQSIYDVLSLKQLINTTRSKLNLAQLTMDDEVNHEHTRTKAD